MDRLKELRYVDGGWSQQQAADALSVSLKTYKRYEQGNAPAMAVRLLAILAGGDLGEINPAWTGWRMVKGQLVSPENVCFSPGEIRALPYQYALIAELKRVQRMPVEGDYCNVVPWPRPKGSTLP